MHFTVKRNARRYTGIRLLIGSSLVTTALVSGAACSGSDKSPPPPPVNGVRVPVGTSLMLEIYDNESGKPVTDAAVTIGATVLKTNAAGQVTFEDLPAGRIAASVRAAEFARATVALDLPAGAHAGQIVRLLRSGRPRKLNADQGGVVAEGGVKVTIPPGALVDEYGTPATGSVNMMITAVVSAPDGTSALPGPLEGFRMSSAKLEPIVSLVMADVSLEKDGKRLQLIPGAKAKIEFVLPDDAKDHYQIGQLIPAWWLDVGNGYWMQEGAGKVVASSSKPGQLAWVVDVAHFTYWNCDDTWDKIEQAGALNCYNVEVVDADGNGVSGQVFSTQYDEPNWSGEKFFLSATSDAQGAGCINAIGKNEDLTPAHSSIYLGPGGAPTGPKQDLLGSGPAAKCPSISCKPITFVMNGCAPGATQPCAYSGPQGTAGVGACKAGEKTCGAIGVWGSCIGEVLPAAIDDCGTASDDNCDGQVNEGCPGFCAPGTIVECPYSGPPGTQNVGVCKAATKMCNLNGTAYGQCGDPDPNNPGSPEVLPLDENCKILNGVDEDCDGLADLADTFDCKCLAGPPPESGMCYDGPPGTENVGICIGGTHTCGDDGKHWNQCTGIAPSSENCVLPSDEDCDGTANEGCPSPMMMSVMFPAVDIQNVRDVAIDKTGAIFIVGTFRGVLNVGGANLISASPDTFDVFVAKFDASGAHKWSVRFGDSALPDDQDGRAIAVDGAGDVFITGTFLTSLKIGNATYTTPGSSRDGFVAKLQGGSGTPIWSSDFNVAGSFDSVNTWGIALDGATNEVVVVGDFNGSFPCAPGVCASNAADLFVRKFNAATGVVAWTKSFGTPGAQSAKSVAINAGDIFLTGSFNTAFAVGCGPQAWTPGGDDAFIAKLDTTGACKWSNILGDSGDQKGVSIALDLQGNPIVLGDFTGVLPAQNPQCGAATSKGADRDVFLTRLSSVDGTCQLQSSFGSANSDQIASDISVDSAGNMLIAGSFMGDISFSNNANDAPITSSGDYDIFIAKLGPTGAHIWSWGFGDANPQKASAVAVDTSGNPAADQTVLVSDVQGTVDFGDGQLVAGVTNAVDITMTKLLP